MIQESTINIPVLAAGNAKRSQFKHDGGKWFTALLAESRFLRQAISIRKSSLARRSGHLWAGSAMIRALADIFESRALEGTAEEAQELATLWRLVTKTRKV